MALIALSSLGITSTELDSGTYLSASSYVTLDTGVDTTALGLQLSFYDANSNLICAVEHKAGASALKTISAGAAEVYITIDNVKAPISSLVTAANFSTENAALLVKLPADFTVPPTAGTLPAVYFNVGVVYTSAPTGTLTLRRTMLNRGSEVAPYSSPVSVAGGGGSSAAVDISTNTVAFNGGLSGTDTNVQIALDTIDNAIGALPEHTVSATAPVAPTQDDIWFDTLTVPNIDADTLNTFADTDFVKQTEVGATNGVAPLDATGLIDQSYLPAVTITDTFVVVSQAAMLALVAQTGDVAVRTDISTSFILRGTSASTLADWEQLLSPGGGVTSVATGTGLGGGPITSTGTIYLANTSVTAGAYGSANTSASFTVDAQGRLTTAGQVVIAITQSQITDLAQHTVSATAPVAPTQDDIWFDTGTAPSISADTLNGFADTDFVRSTGSLTQTVTGVKHFSSNIDVGATGTNYTEVATNGYVNLRLNGVVGGWARGSRAQLADGTTIGGIGYLGNGTGIADQETLTTMHLGWGSSWWGSANSLAVGSGTFQYAGNNIYHAGNFVAGTDYQAAGSYALASHNHDGVYALINGDVNNNFKAKQLQLTNIETTDVALSGQIGLDLNDAAAAARLGSFNSTDPIGLYIHDGTSLKRAWTDDNFTGTNIANWQTAYGWGDHSVAGYSTGKHTVSTAQPAGPANGDIWFDTISVPVVDADTLDGIDSTSFVRSDATDVITGQIDFTGDSPGFSRGINGRYSNVGGNGAFGAAIWGLDTTWLSSDSGNAYSPTGLYGVAWLRVGNANANVNVGEGLHVYQNGIYQAGIGAAGINTLGNITLTGTVDGRDVAADGTKLDGITAGANNYTHPSYASTNQALSGSQVLSAITTNATGHVTSLANRNLLQEDLGAQKTVSGAAAYGYFGRVGGGEYSINSNPATGHVKIGLPVLYTSHMITFTVDVYNYRADRSASFKVGGYNYNGSGAWVNTHASQIGGAVDYNIYFGNDGTKACVWIGDVTDTWYYPKITIRDLTIGLSTVVNSTWRTGWNIDINAVARQTTDKTHTKNRVHNGSYTGVSYFGGAVDVTGNFVANSTTNRINTLYIGSSTGNGYFYSDLPGRTAFRSGDFYIQGTVLNYYNYCPNQFMGNVSGCTLHFRGNTLTADAWSISPTGDAVFNTVDASSLNGQGASYYLDYPNFTNTPSISKHTVSAAQPAGPANGDIWFDTISVPVVDADTLDGNSSSYFATLSGVVDNYEARNNSVDLDTLVGSSGIYSLGNANANAPNSYGTLIHLHNSDVNTQLYMSWSAGLYYRRAAGSTLTGQSWRTILDSVNFTAGVDYASAAHTHTGVYLPLAGKAADSNLLDGIDSTGFSLSGHAHVSADITDLTQHSVSATAPVTPASGDIWFDTATTPTVLAGLVSLVDESADTTCFPTFANTATGNQALKTGSNLTFNSANGTLTATTLNSSSDQALKYNIQDLKAVGDIRAVSWQWKNSGLPGMGYVAQEVEKVLPEAVQGDEGSKSVSYHMVHTAKIAVLEGQVASLIALVRELTHDEPN